MIIFKSLLFLIFLIYPAAAFERLQPLNSGGDVFSIDTGEYTGMRYHIYRVANEWKISLINDIGDSNLTREYMNVASLGARGELDVVITLDFHPGLDCIGEYDILLNEHNAPTETRWGFDIPLIGSSDWHDLSFNNLMIYFDHIDPNIERCN